MSNPHQKPDQIKRIVVRGTNWVGDAVISVPALRRLRQVFPAAHITLVSRPGTADVFTDADFLDEVLLYERSSLGSVWTQARKWRERQFDLALLFQNAFEAAALAFLARVPLRVGYDFEHRGVLLTRSVPLPAWKNDRHEVFYYLNLVDETERLACSKTDADHLEPEFRLDVSSARQDEARRILGERGVSSDQPLVLLCPGSINSRAKRWPAERYAALSDQLVNSGANVALIGSGKEAEVSALVSRTSKHPVTVLTGETTVAQAIAIISVADLLVTNDTGPAHIGSAVRTPTLVIFGPTNPSTTRPFATSAEIVRVPPDCAPCMLRDCPIDHRCMTAITPEDVFARSQKMLTARRPPLFRVG